MTSNLPDLEIDLETLQIRRGGKSIRLTQTEWDLLRALIEQKNKPVSHKYLLQKVWGDVYGKERNYVHHFIASLRKKLGDNPDNPRYILTLPKIGYQWVELQERPKPAQAQSESGLTWHNVAPITLSSFIGRERDLAVLSRKMRDKNVRLLTLTGPGGIGKTRLAFELATQLSEAQLFADGIHFIDLAPVDNPDFVISSIAHEFGLREKAGEDPLTSLKSYLRDKDLLLILDNFEH